MAKLVSWETVPDWVFKLRNWVRGRDYYRCKVYRCGKPTSVIHEITYRSCGKVWSPKIFRKENMCLLCLGHHEMAHGPRSKEIQQKLYRTMKHYHPDYDFDWVEVPVDWDGSLEVEEAA